VSCNPVLESYGNAKTTRNNNSSRFGKFIRIHFTNAFGIAGADIESYLLEKSRITYQMPAERNYHIFYQLCTKAFPDMVKNELFLEHDPGLYNFINQGMLTIDKVDDEQEMRDTQKAMDILLFTKQQQLDLFKITAAVMHWGNQKWQQKPREEQAEANGTEEITKVAKLVGTELDTFVLGLLKPKIKVGKEFVNKGQNQIQVQNSCAALSKAMYARAFNWLVVVCNETLDVKNVKRAYFIGVLDIAGFETFEENGFEQLCINFTNERLQQFFNNFMFVLEQEEIIKEGIEWQMESFGADLQATIDLIDKPMGIFSMLEEECVVPKGTDMTYKDKLHAKHLGKHPSFGKPKPSKSKYEAHFELHHYAGTVAYGVNGWLDKNKDPINEFVAAMFKAQKSNALLAYLFEDIGVEVKAGGKKGSQTISANHREQLNKLMKTLGATAPHFVRCIIPNEIKTGGIIDAHLVMHQLNCNGVLEGIRICRKGFPSKIAFADFVLRYCIIEPAGSKGGAADKDAAKKATQAILATSGLNADLFRVGLNRVLFKAGVLGTLEEQRDAAISKILTMLQAHMRTYIMKKNIQKLVDQKKAIGTLQRNIKSFSALRSWGWWNLMAFVKPLLNNSKKEEERLAREAEEARLAAEAAAAAAAAQAAAAEAATRALEEAKKAEEERQRKIEAEQAALKESIAEAEANAAKLASQKADLESQVKDLEDRISSAESQATDLSGKKKKLEAEITDLKQNIQDATTKVQKLEAENKSKEAQIRKLQDEMSSQDDTNSKLAREKKRLEEVNAKTLEQLQQEEDKVSHLSKVKSKLEQTLEEAEESLEREKKGRADLDKVKRRLDSELKSAQAQIEEIEKLKKDVEEALKRKDAELGNTLARVEEEHAQVTLAQKKIKELQQNLAEAEEATEAERQTRIKIEKQRADLTRELEELNEKLEEAGGATNAQLDLNRKREAELAKVRRDLEESNAAHESNAAQLRKKLQESLAEKDAQIDSLQKARAKLEKEKQITKSEVEEARAQTESVQKSQGQAAKLAKQLEHQIQELNARIDESGRHLSEANSQRSKLQAENSNLTSQLEEFETRVGEFSKVKQQLSSQIEDARRSAEDESRGRTTLQQQIRALNADLESARTAAEEEHNAKAELQRQFAKVQAEFSQYKAKHDGAGGVGSAEVEEIRRRLSAKLIEAEEQAEQATSKAAGLEKAKQRLQNELDDVSAQFEKASANVLALDKRQKQFDKLVADWKQKIDSATVELEAAQKEARAASAESYRLRSQIEEYQASIETLNRENRSLVGEIKDLTEQLGSGGRTVSEAQKIVARVQAEKAEIQKALEGAEQVAQQYESRLANAHAETAAIRVEIERKLHEKDEEHNNTKRNHARAIESVQITLESETKAKAEAQRQKKKIEAEINEIEIALATANRNNAELQKSNKKLQQATSELQAQIEEEQKHRAAAREATVAAERRAIQLAVQIDESKAALEHANRATLARDAEIRESGDRNAELTAQVSNLNGIKRKLENDAQQLRNDYLESVNELRSAEGKLKIATSEITRLTDLLNVKHDTASNAEKSRLTLQQQVADLQTRLVEAEGNTSKGGKRVVSQLEARIVELENERDSEARSHTSTTSQLRKAEKSLRDLASQADDDKKNQSRLQDHINSLESKIKAFKKQIEQAEEIAALNLSKYRKAQAELNEAGKEDHTRSKSRGLPRD